MIKMMNQNWTYKRIGSVCNVKTGKLDANASDENGIYPFFTCSKEPLRINAYSYDAECVLIAGNGDLNVKYYNGKFDAYQRTYILTIKNGVTDISMQYLYHFFQLYVDTLRKNSIGGVIKYIKLGDITEAKIPVPPPVEQERIVAELDLLTGVIEKQKAQLKELDTLAQSIFYDMFGDPVKNEKGWDTNELKLVAPQEQYRGKVPSVNGKYWLLNLDMIQQQTGMIIEKILFDQSEIGNSIIVFDNTNVLYSKLRPYLNKVALPDDVGYASSELVPLKPNPLVLERMFFANLLRCKSFVDYISVKVAGAKMPRVSLDVLRAFPVILPPLQLQQKFAEKIEAIEHQKTLIKKSIEETQKLFEYTMDKYFG